jgi:hypothetical protein
VKSWNPTCLALTLLLASFTCIASGDPLEAITGFWVGRIDDTGILRMHLVEVTPDSITGWVVTQSWWGSDSLEVRRGFRSGSDSLYLDASCGFPPPIGCIRILEGELRTPDTITGVYRGRDGHDPPFSLPCSANRVPIAVSTATWGQLKQRYSVAFGVGPNIVLHPPRIAGRQR